MNIQFVRSALSATVLAAGASFSASATATIHVPCASLSVLSLPDTTITLAEEVSSGSLTVAVPPAFVPRTIGGLPPFCRVAGVIRPTSESNILFEVWLPLSNWNGRFAGVGNGMLAGSIIYAPIGTLTDSLSLQLSRGYAVASTDTGHPAGVDPARFAFEHPEQLMDFGRRAVHEMTVKGKAITRAFYGKGPSFSYWYGCSTGGNQGLMEAQHFPADYDGIVAGSPANNRTATAATALDNAIRIQKDSANNLPQDKLELLADAVLAACDAKDGVVDGLLEDPRRCNFDPGHLQCGGDADPGTCLTREQVQSARSMYEGLINPTTGATIYPGRERGSERLWAPFTVGPVNPVTAASYARWIAFADPNWDWTRFDFRNPEDFQAFFASDPRLIPILNSMDPDLRAFRRRGGKLIQYHGWADNNPIPPRNSINYFESVVSFFGGGKQRRNALKETQRFYRLFMAPGMAHCQGAAPGPNTFDTITAIENWVEKGVAPKRITAARVTGNVVDMTRPLCVYPKQAVYSGSGDTSDASSFVCRNVRGGNNN